MLTTASDLHLYLSSVSTSMILGQRRALKIKLVHRILEISSTFKQQKKIFNFRRIEICRLNYAIIWLGLNPNFKIPKRLNVAIIRFQVERECSNSKNRKFFRREGGGVVIFYAHTV